MTRHSVEIQEGFDVHLLRSESVQVRIVPELGAKIAGLQCLSSGREWMWAPSDGSLFRNLQGDPFADSTLVGADECFPTIEPCLWEGRVLPDHGEVWAEAWKVEVENERIVTSLRCPISPFGIRREASLSGNELRLDYTLKNVSNQPESYLWALHPLMRIEPGDRIDLPASNIRTDLAINCPLGGRGTCWEWPVPLPGIQLDQMNFGPHLSAATKIYTNDLQEGRVTIRNDKIGGGLEFLFDLEELDTAGIYIGRGGWKGYHHFAIEPTNSATDPLDAATRENKCGQLPPGDVRRWTVILKTLT